MNHIGASVFTIPTTLGLRMRVSVSQLRGTAHPIYDLSRNIATGQLDALTVRQRITSPIIIFTSTPTCWLVETQLQLI